jgi:hypothetical protein
LGITSCKEKPSRWTFSRVKLVNILQRTLKGDEPFFMLVFSSSTPIGSTTSGIVIKLVASILIDSHWYKSKVQLFPDTFFSSLLFFFFFPKWFSSLTLFLMVRDCKMGEEQCHWLFLWFSPYPKRFWVYWNYRLWYPLGLWRCPKVNKKQTWFVIVF